MAQTANEALRDAMVRHQVQLQRFSAGVVKKIVELLNATEQDIAAQIRERLLNSTGLDTPADVNRLNRLLKSLEALRTSAFDNLTQELNDQLIALAQAEPRLLAHQLDVTSPVILDLALPSVDRLKAIVSSQPFEGRTLKEWASTLQSQDKARLEGEIRKGMTAGEDSATIARRLVGSARLAGQDGVLQITRQNAASIARTAINHVSNQARRQFINLNKDVLDEEMFVATLDARTTPICRSLDGNIYDVGKGPIPPLHWGCRSLRVAVFGGQALGSRPMKASTEKQLLREFAAQEGIEAPASRDDLPHGSKGRFDAFARKRVRELTGTVPASTTYQEWLTSQSAQFQDDVLGPTRAKLFRDGGLTLDKFVNRAGDEINLAQLATLQAAAFKAAGLDPGAFK